MQNPRFNRISFHTFRHWKATTEYHKTKDILHVKELLGHKSIKNTLIYTHLVDFEEDNTFIVKVAARAKIIDLIFYTPSLYVVDTIEKID